MSFDLGDLPSGELYVGGEWRKGQGADISSEFPADGTLNRVLAGASSDDVELAVSRAAEAAHDPKWRNLLPHERADYLYRISDGIRANADRISFIQSRDTGKTRTETKALAMSAAGTFRYFAAVLETLEKSITPSRGRYISISDYEPMGAVAAITPWNSPIASDAQKIAPALAAGNGVVLKPASWSPLVSLELARIIDEAGLPKGLFSTLPGSGPVVGDGLVMHPDVARVSFTGGTTTGRSIAVKAAEKLMPVSLELGGKSPTIVFADADIDLAIAGILFGIFSSSGQSCIAGSRLLVEDTIYASFVARLVAATKNLVVGHPFDAATQVAPLIHPRHRQSVEDYITLAMKEGGRLLAGGQRPEGAQYECGNYLLPTVIDGLSNDARVCREEIFGPVLIVMPFRDEAEALSIANDNDYGLASGIWTRDLLKARRMGSAIKTGTVWVNTYKQFSIATPFGGVKDSGVGLEKGIQGLRAYMNQKSWYIDVSETPHPWAIPALEGLA